MFTQIDAAYSVNKYVQQKYYSLCETSGALHGLIASLEYICRGLEDSQKICRESMGVILQINRDIDKLGIVLSPFMNYGFRDKYEEKP